MSKTDDVGVRQMNSPLGDIPYILANGVPAEWLSGILGVPIDTLRKRLVGVPVLRYGRSRKPYYDTRVVFEYIVQPRKKLQDWLKNLSPKELPPHLQPTAWQAVERQLRVELQSGQLWHTAEVVEILVDLLAGLRSDMLMLADNVERITDLSPEQREVIGDLVRAAVASAYRRVSEYPAGAKPLREQLSSLSILTGEDAPLPDPPDAGEDSGEDNMPNPFS